MLKTRAASYVGSMTLFSWLEFENVPYLVHFVTYTHCLKKIDEHLYKPYAFCPRIQWTQIKLPLSFCFNIYTFINSFSQFIPQRQCMLSTSLNGFLHVFISYDRHLLYFWQGAKGYSKASTFTFPFYLHHTTISKQSWI